jgi:anthranilate phosphoribosyltransferase
MFILAAGGAAVVKHGNRSVTSACGSADVLEALGVRVEWPPNELRECLQRVGLCFIHAPTYHAAFRALSEMRAEPGTEKKRTIFNLLGPLLNPVRPPRQLIGVYSPRLTTMLAEVLRQLGRERAWVVHGTTDAGDGMDDISICGATTLAELSQGRASSAVIDCRWLGIPGASVADLRGSGSVAENAKTVEGILSGEVKGAKRDLAVVNAAGGFVVAGLARDLRDGIALAIEQIERGAALRKLNALREFSC